MALYAYWTFAREFCARFRSTGSVIPSSRFLARALTDPLRSLPVSESGRRILEAGPGTGPVTAHIAPLLQPNDAFDLVELNQAFVRVLNRRFEEEPVFRRVRDQSRVLHQPVEEVANAERYDIVVSGLPLNNFSVAEVERILAQFRRLLKPGGTISFFEYIAVRRVRGLAISAAERKRVHEVGAVLNHFLDAGTTVTQRVLLNFPPAWSHSVTIA